MISFLPRFVVTLLFLGATQLALSQVTNAPCYTSELQEAWFQKNPEKRRLFDEARSRSLAASEHLRPSAAGIYTIPVVFHILHTGGNENISDAQVIDQVNILTRDFNKLNADTVNAHPAFKSIIGNPQIVFELAKRDPNGNCTNGIIRHWDNNTHAWDGNFSDYLYSWPSNQYLNVYVVKTITFNAAGYTYLPASGVPPAVDCIVMLSSYVGSIGTSNVSLSRVLTHECGHWLDLEHTWGWNAVGTVCGDDGVSDTPITKGFTSCTPQAQICTSGIFENVQNYMDYSYCCLMFTAGQAARMQSAMTNPGYGRDGLSTSQNLLQTGITNPGSNCQTQLELKAVPGATICTGKPLAVKCFTWNANPQSYQWSASAPAVIAAPGSQSTTIVFSSPGTVTVSCIVNSAGGSVQKSVVVTVVNGLTDITTNTTEQFNNGGVALPALWSIDNPTTPSETWLISPINGVNGSGCVCAPGEIFSPGTEEFLISPSYDFKNYPGATFGFKYAYAKAAVTHADVFKVQASADCGNTWTDVWVPGMTFLSQGSGGVSSTLFQPNANQWKYYEVSQHPNFMPFLNEDNVRFRFYFKEDPSGNQPGNRFYLDDITYTRPVGISELALSEGLTIYPNPNAGSFVVKLSHSPQPGALVLITDIAGRVVYSADFDKPAVEINEDLASGIYFVKVVQATGIAVRKMLVE